MWLERCCRFPDTTHELQILLITYKPKNPPRESWNKGRLVGPKPPFKLQEIRAMRIRPDLEHRIRELAMLNTPIDSKLRGCDLARLEVSDLMQGCHAISRAPGGAAQDAAARFGRCRPVAATPPTIAVPCRRRKADIFFHGGVQEVLQEPSARRESFTRAFDRGPCTARVERYQRVRHPGVG